MNTPERICEALEWLYGAEFDFDDDVSYLENTAYIFDPKGGASVNGQRLIIFVRDDGGATAAWPYRRREDITANVTHALFVTAPWEWMDCETGVFLAQIRSDLAAQVQQNRTVADSWEVTTPDGVTHSGIAQSVDAAKTAARAAYLTWMRGRFAMKGGAA